MNRSYSKIRHIQETNEKLEKEASVVDKLDSDLTKKLAETVKEKSVCCGGRCKK